MSEVETLKKMTPEDVSKLLQALTPAQLSQIRARAIAAGLPATRDKVQRLADGSIRIQVTLPREVAEPLNTWADAADESGDKLHAFLEKIIVDSTTAFVFQDWGGAEAPPPAKAETPVPASGIPAGTPAAAAAATTT